MADELRPIIAVDAPDASMSPRLRLLTHIVRISAGIACAGAVAMSVYYFIGFAENDNRAFHLLNAVGICFGVGALFFLPTLYIARKAHLALTNGPTKNIIFRIFPVILPWAFVGLYFLKLEGHWSVIGGIMLLLFFQLIFWAVTIYKATK